MTRLSRPTLIINIPLMGENETPVAGPRCASWKLCNCRLVFASHNVTAPSSDTVTNIDFLNAEYSS